MARYEHLPIINATLDAAVHFEQVVAGFSRYHKHSCFRIAVIHPSLHYVND